MICEILASGSSFTTCFLRTLRKHNPYFIMQIVLDIECVGIISYSYNEEQRCGFINNFYICPKHRNAGIGSAVYRMVEAQLKSLGAVTVELVPVGKALNFYVRNGFTLFRTTVDGEQVYCKRIV